MSGKAGIWIDHRRTVILFLDPAQERIVHLESHVETQQRRAGDSPLEGSFEARQVPSDDRRQKALSGELNRYYDAVIAAAGGASAVLILGPGEAKGELRARFDHHRLGAGVAAVETADKMTDAQISARVREYFGGSLHAGQP